VEDENSDKKLDFVPNYTLYVHLKGIMACLKPRNKVSSGEFEQWLWAFTFVYMLIIGPQMLSLLYVFLK
jgi:hypothetical protein